MNINSAEFAGVVTDTGKMLHAFLHIRGARRMVLFDYPDSAIWRIKKSCMGLHLPHFLLSFLLFPSYNIEKIGLKRFNLRSVSLQYQVRSLCFPLPCSLAKLLYPKSIPQSLSCVGGFVG
jgi:hypothetical protein